MFGATGIWDCVESPAEPECPHAAGKAATARQQRICA
jgi:hypothetical protein